MKFQRFQTLCAQGAVAGKRVFIRADLNVPQDADGRITEDTRVRASVPCIEMALKAGAAVMVTSHLGAPDRGGLSGNRQPCARGRASVCPAGSTGALGIGLDRWGECGRG